MMGNYWCLNTNVYWFIYNGVWLFSMFCANANIYVYLVALLFGEPAPQFMKQFLIALKYRQWIFFQGKLMRCANKSLQRFWPFFLYSCGSTDKDDECNVCKKSFVTPVFTMFYTPGY